MYKRKDGTVLTNDCPVGLRTLKRFVHAKTVGLIAFLSSTLLSGCTTGGDNSHLQGQVMRPGPNKGKVVYAIKNISAGKIISAEAIEEREMPVDKVPVDLVDSASFVVGKVAKIEIKAGQVICLHDLR